MAIFTPSSPVEEDADVNAPFLPDPDQTDCQHEQTSETKQDAHPSSRLATTRRRILLIVILIFFGFELGALMIPGPMIRIIESIACHTHWAAHDPSRISSSGRVPEELCKIPDVQTTVTIIKGYHDLFESISTTLFAIPFGLLADRYGRQRAIRLTAPGFILNGLITNTVMWFPGVFPLWCIWLASLSWIFGGGPTVLMAILWTIVADVTPDSQRTIIYMRILAIGMIGNFVSKLVSSSLMLLDPWIPVLIGCGFLFLSIGCAFLLPETLGTAAEGQNVETPVASASRYAGAASYSAPSPRKRWWLDLFLSTGRERVSPHVFLFKTRLTLLLLTFLIYSFYQCSSSFLVQYVSARFKWSLASANFVVSLQPAFSLPIFLFVIPYLSKRRLSHLPSLWRDQHLAKASSICLTLGALGIGLSPYVFILVPSLLLEAAGSGFPFLIRLMVTGLVPRDQTAIVYTVIQVLQSIGNIGGILGITNIFTIGLKLGGLWTGLAWIVSSMLLAVLAIIIWVVKLPEWDKGRRDEEMECL